MRPPSRRADSVAILVALSAAMTVAAPVAAQQPDPPASVGMRPVLREALRGRVTTGADAAVVGAEVIATRAPDRAVFRTRTDGLGRFAILVDSGTGDYLLFVGAPDTTLRAVRRRVVRAAPTDTVTVVDVVLSAGAVATLAPVRVTARPPTVTRSEPPELARGNDRDADAFSLALAPDAAGDYTAAGARLPGARATGDGYSVLGVGSAQNQVTLNGLAIPATALPREAETRASVATTTYDPSIGWFGGTQTAITLAAGRTFTDRRGSVAVDAPALQTTAAGAGTTREFTRVIAGLGGSGLGFRDHLAYSYGLQASTRRSESHTLTSATDGELGGLGLARDSLTRFLDALDRAGVPLIDPARGVRETRGASLIARLNTPERNVATYEDLPHSAGLVLFGSHEETSGPLDAPFAASAGEPRSTRSVGSIQGVYSSLRRRAVLGELRSGLTVGDRRESGGVTLPSGAVLVRATNDAEPGAALTALTFGGTGAADSRQQTVTWHSQAETRFISPRTPLHRFKATADLRYDGVRRDAGRATPGSLAYRSLADLEAGRPASFSRTLGVPVSRGGTWNGALAVGDLWRVSRQLRLMLGARAEGTTFPVRPPANPAVASAFGVRTDHVPDGVHVSPRLGFSWNTGRGTASTGGDGLTRMNVRSLGVVRGGIGEFRSLLGPELVANRAGFAGLPTGARSLRCIGAAAPAPDWTRWARDPGSIPTACADGTPALVDSAPAVQLIEPGYRAPRSWRANLAWGAAAGPLVLSAEAIASWNVDQPGVVDRNFGDRPRFRSPGEERDVFVPSSAIVPATGAVNPASGRRLGEFGAVRALSSDGRAVARQLSVSVAPNLPGDPPVLGSVTYTLGRVRELGNGFSTSTFGSPTARAWSRGDLDIRHSIDVQLDARKHGWVTLALWGRLNSGAPFTPVVSGDVNGDGLANDRAFVFGPAAAATDAALGGDLSALLRRAPPAVRRCLQRQAGRAAARNSCEGPWTATMDASLGLDARRLGLGARRAAVTLHVQNVLAGADRLLNGRGGAGWSRPAAPDPVLYTVRGFDPAEQRFLYEVNPRFGSSHVNGGALRAPFRVTLDVRVNLGTAYPVQQVERFLRPGRNGFPGPRLDVPALRKRYSRSVPDPYARVLAESDSLLLRPEQERALLEAQRGFAARMDSAWTALAETLAALPDDFDATAALRAQEEATDRVWAMARDDIQAVLPRVLDRLQLTMLPYPASMLLETKGKVVPKVRGFF